MAALALNAANIRLLAQSSTTYWEDEASVNGIWLALLTEAFPSSEGYVLQPEGQGEGSKMRNDILVRKITDFTTGQQTAYLVFEGKSSKGDNLDTASKQLLDFVMASPKLNTVGKVWGIVARGTTFRAISYQNKSEVKLTLQKAGTATNGKPSISVGASDYNLSGAYDKPGSVESVQAFLAFAKQNMGWIPSPV